MMRHIHGFNTRHNRILGWLSVAIGLLAWTFAATWAEGNIRRAEVLLPSPIAVIRSIPGLAVFRGSGAQLSYPNALIAIWENTYASAIRLLGGLAIGTALGLGTGLLLGYSRKVRLAAQSPLLLLRTVPLLALIPLFLTWFGGAESGVFAFIAFAVFSMLLVNTLEAVRNTGRDIQLFARTLGASRFRVYRTVVMPAIVPELVGGMRAVLGIAWAILLAAEFLVAQRGIGHVLILANRFSYTDRMVLIVLLIMLYTYALDRLVTKVSARATRWVPRGEVQGAMVEGTPSFNVARNPRRHIWSRRS